MRRHWQQASIEEWRAVFHRAVAEEIVNPNMPVPMHFGTSPGLHSSMQCPGIRSVDHIPARDLVQREIPTWCECRGWLGSRLGVMLDIAAESWDLEDLRHGTREARSWWEIHQVLETTERADLRRNRDRGKLEELQDRGRTEGRAWARREAARLGPQELMRSLAAQVMRVEVDAGEAQRLIRWSADQRISESDRRQEWRELDETLTDRIASDPDVLVAIRRDPDTHRDALPHGMRSELALLLWQFQDESRWTLVNLPRCVAEGALRVGNINRSRTVLVATEPETDPDLLATIKVLLQDSDTYGPADDLQETLETARSL